MFGEGERVDHAQLAGPLGGGVMLGSHRDDPDDAWPQPPGAAGAYVVVDDVDAAFAQASAAGALTVYGPADSDEGRVFTVRDPEGNLWSFGTYRGEPG